MSFGLNHLFAKVIVVNLDRRPDRMKAIDEQLKFLNVDYERYPAFDGLAPEVNAEWQEYFSRPLVSHPTAQPSITSYKDFYLGDRDREARVAFVEQKHGKKAISSPGAWGLLKSMTGAVKMAIEKKWPSVLILEDDVIFHKETVDLLRKTAEQVKEDWLMIQLGAMQLHWETDWIAWHSPNLYMCNGSSIAAHAVGLKAEVLPTLLEECLHCDLPYDIGALQLIKRNFRAAAFTCYPNIAIQDASDSEISMSTMFFSEVKKKNNIYRWEYEKYGLSALSSSHRRSDSSHSGSEPIDVSIPPWSSATVEAAGSRVAGAASDPNAAWIELVKDLVDRLETRIEGHAVPQKETNPELGAIRRKLEELEKGVASLKTSSPRQPQAETRPKPKPNAKKADENVEAKGLRGRLRRWRKGQTDAKAPENVAAEMKPRASDEPPLVPFYKEIGNKWILGVTAFGLDDQQLVKVIDIVEAGCARRGAMPVFFTDNASFELFRARRLVFEYLPPPELREKLAPDLLWPLYLQRRYAQFERKWQPSGVISFGKRLPVQAENDVAGNLPGTPPLSIPRPLRWIAHHRVK